METTFVFRHKKSVDRAWARELGGILLERFMKAGSDYEFVDSVRWMDETIISRPFIPENLQSVHIKFAPMIFYVCRFFECYAIWEKHIQSPNPITVISINGYKSDVNKAYNIIRYVIDNLNFLQLNLQMSHRKTKKYLRNKGLKGVTQDARAKAYDYITARVNILNEILKHSTTREYSVSHEYKMNNVGNAILKRKTLNFNKRRFRTPNELRDAFCSFRERIPNKIIDGKSNTKTVKDSQ